MNKITNEACKESSVLKGNYPFAVLHELRTNGAPSAIGLAIKLSKVRMSKREAIEYVRTCEVTSGHPNLLDLYEHEEDGKSVAKLEMLFKPSVEQTLDKLAGKRVKQPVTSLLGQTGLELEVSA